MKRILLSAACLCVGVASSAFAAARLDEDEWPQVTPEYLGPSKPEAEAKSYPFAAPQTLEKGGGPEKPGDFVAGDKRRFNYVFRGKAPDFPFSGRMLLNRSGSFWSDTIRFTADNVADLGDGRWRLSFEYAPPMYFDSGDYAYGLTVRGLCGSAKGLPYPNGRMRLVRRGTIPGFERKVVAHVQDVNGSPEFVIDGKPTYALWGVTSSRSPTGRHSDMPLNVITIWSSSLRWHPATNKFLSSVLDGLAEKFRRVTPEAYYIWDLTVYPPPDWAEAHPEELVVDEEGMRKKHKKPLFSFASRAAMDVMRDELEKAIRHLEASPYANRIIGYRISSGDTPEWLAWTARKGHAYDFSAPSVAAFKKWASEHYPELANPYPPTYAERTAVDNGDDILWNQRKHLAAVAFNEFYSDLAAENCIELSVLAKKLAAPDKLVGTYHGYSHFLCVGGTTQHRALFAFKKVLDAKCIDFVCSPQSYSVRRLGEPFVDMKPFGTTMMNGVLSVCENDARTHNGRMLTEHRYDQSLTAYQTIMKMRRDFAAELCRRHPAYCYPIASFVGFDFPGMAEEGRTFRIVGQHLLDTSAPRRRAEIAYVVGERSITSLSSKQRGASTGELIQTYETNGVVAVEKTAPLNYPWREIFAYGLGRWGRSGAPIDYVLAEDMCDHPGDYKLYVFAHDFKYDDAFRRAVEKIRERGATMLWLYAPGWAHGVDCGTQCMKDLTDIEFAKAASPMLAGVTMEGEDGRFMGMPSVPVSPLFYPVRPDKVLGRYSDGTPGLAMVRQGKSKAIFYGGWQTDQKFIRDVLDEAGVFVYSDSNDPVEANEKLFTLHARYAGVKKVRLPRRTDVLDVFGRRIVAKGVDSFEFDAPLHSTHLFYLADDAEALLAKLAR